MRDRDSWHRSITRELSRLWDEVPSELGKVKPSLLCQVELALVVLERIAPDEPPAGAYTLFGGYEFARARGHVTTPEHEVTLTASRHLLWHLRRRRTWQLALETYQALPDRFRAFDIPSSGAPARRREPSVASDRFAVYATALTALPPLARNPLSLAPAGRATFIDRRRPTSVTLPEWLKPQPGPGHEPEAGRPGTGRPLSISRAALLETARWMDATEQENEVDSPGHWENRLAELHILPRDPDGLGFSAEGDLRLDGLLHLAGMVGAGKSTLMTLLAVWGARQQRRLRTTLVVGDVAEQLRLTTLFRDLGLAATPVLGLTTRETHVQRLHRRAASRGKPNLLDHDDPGFDHLSTVCVLDALRGTEAGEPLRFADAPCTSLHPEKKATQDEKQDDTLPAPYEPGRRRSGTVSTGSPDIKGTPHGCPAWYVCPRHRAARELVDAVIWVANPASLVQSAVPRHLGDERLRHLELTCLRSDIIIVDEADSVQMRLDEIFAPSATLVRPDVDSWLDQVQTHRVEEISRQGRLPLTDKEIERWSTALNVVHAAADRLYKRLISEPDLHQWVDIEYFSPWTLQEKLMRSWFDDSDSGVPDGVADESDLYEAYEDDPPASESPGPDQDARRAELTGRFDAFRDDPLGGHGPYGNVTDALVRLTHDLLNTLSPTETRERVLTVLRLLLSDTPMAEKAEDTENAENTRWLDETAQHLEFMLLLSALDHRLEQLVYLWPQVEAALRLDSTGNEFSRRPPLDYAPLIPEAPMGNVLGFQYLPDDQERNADGQHSGTLRFFRCAGVGRELLLALPDVGADPDSGRRGPHVILMSGTSWAGTSTRAHLVAPVGAVLTPSRRSLEAVSETEFTTRFLYDDHGRPLSLSGTKPKARPAACKAMVKRLGQKGLGGAPSPLEDELAKVTDPRRRRAILLVGSYKEATLAADTLHAMPRWHGRVRVLAADDAELDEAVPGSEPPPPEEERATALRRGDLATFAEDPEAEILVAPLMAVERGHNILNSQRNAAFGTALFLARPHPRPDDLTLAVFAVNNWATRFTRDEPGLAQGTFSKLAMAAPQLDDAGLAFRHVARGEWRRLLSRRYIYSRLSPPEKKSFAWDQLVTIWQVIGRLVRGGVPARVVFVDARFAPRTAELLAPGAGPAQLPDEDGLLTGLRDVLAPYFADGIPPSDCPDPADPVVARLLYAPLFKALSTITHHTD
ncbi:pPIWI_RE_Z domain-containing protein [Streptomyces niveiscabiei]|uniref:pPIWI-RE three-gene island domain-containing protein n=1 Tax=Streptomyces niveiscabiei TaxID=164115 RepID=A0ABW9I1N9_9ACTN